MKAMILAAGKGTRLGEITREIPKPLVEAGGKPMILHVAERLRDAGVTEVVINLHYLGKKIADYFETHGCAGMKFSFSWEKELLGTGGGVKAVRSFFEGEKNFFLYNADVYCSADLRPVLTAASQSAAIATLVTMSRRSSRELLFTAHGNLMGWESAEARKSDAVGGEVATASQRQSFCGVQLLSSEIFDYMESESGEFSIIRVYMNAARAGKSVRYHTIDGAYWMDMGSPEKLTALREHLQRKSEKGEQHKGAQ